MQNEEKIDYQLIALMALTGLYDKYKVTNDKDDLCVELHILLDFAYKHNAVNDLFLEAVNLIIKVEDLISWQRRATRE